MSKFNNSHPYVEALFHAMLAEQKSWKTIYQALPIFYPLIEHVYPLEDETDRAYIVETDNELIVSVSGTKSKKGWVRNLLCWTDNGWHYGFRRSFKDFLCEPFLYALNKSRKYIKVKGFGHSAGSSIVLNLNYFIRNTLHRPCETITFCGPQAVDRKGKAQCKKVHVCNTTLNIGRRDQVDDVGKIVGGEDYGYIVKLPDVGDPDTHRNELIDDYFYGHAPSYVCKSLKRLMQYWNQPQDGIIDRISEYAIK